jgi:hypothetical protein
VKRRRRVDLSGSWDSVVQNLPDDSNWGSYVLLVPAFTVWYWIVGIPEDAPPDG